ncbi:MAG TPA: M20/M25/M40 family metallo-hydrolase, partial [Pyrinomonadaceae bacterium]|nr:M20/M25/M40 family metallo-hydrolase [Pyrinomonadaceae bacterium]
MRHKFFGLLSIITLAFALAFAQQPGTSAPSVDRLRQVITYLASDALEGRRTGTPGATEAANYIAGEFNRLGLLRAVFPPARPTRPTRPTRSSIESLTPYFQPFPYVAQVELGKNNALTITSHGVLDAPQMTSRQTLRVGTDWMPLGFSSNAKIESDALIFAGYGISAPELKYDDYAVSPRDRVAIIFEGTPDGDNPHGQFARAGELRFKVAAARAAGARALVLISGENNLNDDRLSRLSYDNAGEAGLPVVVISRSAAATLLGGAEGLSGYEKSAKARTPSLPIPKRVSLSVDVVRRESPSYNVVGILRGSDPILSDLNEEAIVIGAHYDHLGRGGEGSLAPREGEIHHGADDNASGVAGLIELARVLSTQNPKPRRTIVFIAFSGEEEGLLGSDYYVNHPIMPLAKTVAMINMDMIGRLQDSKLIVGGVGTAPEWRSIIQSENTVEKIRAAAASNLNASGSPNYQVSLNGQASLTGFP